MNVLCVVGHPDDEVLMCGGTIAKHAEAGDTVRVFILADGESSRDVSRAEIHEAIRQRVIAGHAASEILGHDGNIAGYEDQCLDKLGSLMLTKRIEIEVRRFQPEVVYTHWTGDMNADHRAVAEATLVACRPNPDCSVREVLMGEVPSSTEWAGGFVPDVFVDITAQFAKKEAALKCYSKEISADVRHPRSNAAILALAYVRGVSAGVSSAEAFKLVRSKR